MKQELKNIVIHGELLFQEPLSRHTSYAIGGPAEVFVRPANHKELAEVLRFAYNNQSPITLLGAGSNCLVHDIGVDGIVISLAGTLDTLNIEGNKVIAEAGVMLGHLVRSCSRASLAGMEGLVGIPGTLGGALIMNAGAHGKEISNYLTRVHTLTPDGKEKVSRRDDLQFGYRRSSFSPDEIIIKAEFLFEYGSADTIQKLRKKASKTRKASQPLRYRSAGSVFRNPAAETSAGLLIDQAGLKGTRRGGAEISRQHGNFFINHGKATAEDVAYLIILASRTINQQFGIQLDLEIKPVGFNAGYWEDAGIAG
ncbi:UDP-N-acetylmuramate dehydrogenase [Candidatus Neomarinimicrobiota bacterium]